MIFFFVILLISLSIPYVGISYCYHENSKVCSTWEFSSAIICFCCLHPLVVCLLTHWCCLCSHPYVLRLLTEAIHGEITLYNEFASAYNNIKRCTGQYSFIIKHTAVTTQNSQRFNKRGLLLPHTTRSVVDLLEHLFCFSLTEGPRLIDLSLLEYCWPL